MTALSTTVFNTFRDAARAGHFYPDTRTNADDSFTRQFVKWGDMMGVHAVTVDDPRYDRAWIFNLVSRNVTRRASNYPLNLLCILVNTKTGQLEIRTRKQPSKNHQIFLEQRIHGETGITGGDINWTLYADIPFSQIRKKLYTRAAQASHDIAAHAHSATTVLKIGDGRVRQKLSDEAQNAARGTLFAQIDAAMTDAESFLDRDAIAASEKLYKNVIFNQKANSLTAIALYNHIVSATALPRARESRISALPLVGKTGALYLDNAPMWSAIDRGESVFKAIGDALGVRADTIRNMVKNPALFAGNPKSFSRFARFLNVVPHPRWPKNFAERSTFHFVCTLAEAYGDAFGIPSPAVLQQWLKEAGPRCRWRHLAFIKLKKQMRLLQEDKTGLLRSLDLLARHKIPSTPPEEDPRLHARNLIRMDMFWNLAQKKYRGDLSGIFDLKRDLDRRLIRAALIRATDAVAMQLSSDTLDTLQNLVHARLWQGCPPSEQIEASSYWHSPRINFNNRFSSVTNTLGMSWHTLFDKPLVIDGVTVVPLGSDEALRAEAAVMKHCVWSYGSYCLRGKDHIFGLRDAAGRHLSTLDLAEKNTENGKVFSIVQNNSVQNSRAPADAVKAGQKLCNMLNEGKIAIDWSPILADRAAYDARQIDASVGYDFRDPAILQHVFDLYEPCLPRKLSRASGGTLDGLSRALGIPDLIATHLKPASAPQPPRPAAP